jgi:hypothetical protein
MSLIDIYCNQEVSWIPAQRNIDGTVKKDGSGKTLYGPEQKVKAVLNDKNQMVRDKTGAEVTSSGYAKLTAVVEVDDKINGRVVIGRNIHKDFTGQDEGRTVYLK